MLTGARTSLRSYLRHRLFPFHKPAVREPSPSALPTIEREASHTATTNNTNGTRRTTCPGSAAGASQERL